MIVVCVNKSCFSDDMEFRYLKDGCFKWEENISIKFGEFFDDKYLMFCEIVLYIVVLIG